MKIINVSFFSTVSGNEPVRSWLKKLSKEDRKTVGQDIKTVELGWPIGMPLVRKMKKDLWEVRIDISDSRIARVLFTVVKRNMVLLHAFIKKSQSTPQSDLDVADERRNKVHK